MATTVGTETDEVRRDNRTREGSPKVCFPSMRPVTVFEALSAMGHEDAFPAVRLNGGVGFESLSVAADD